MVDKSALIGGIAGGILGVILIVVIIIAVFYCRRNFNRRTNKRAKFITSDGEVLTKKWPQDHIPVEERAEWDKSNPGLPKQMFFNEVNDEEEHVEVHEKRAIEQFERVAEAPPAAPAPVPLRPVTPPPPRHERYVVERPPIRIERPPAIEEQERALIITDEVPEPEPFRFPVPEPEPIRGPVPVIVSELLQSRVVTHQAPVVVDQGPMPVFVAPLQ